MKRLIWLLTAAVVLLSPQLKSQILDYDYRFKVKGATDTVYLAYYFGKQLYYSDTAVSTPDGSFAFKKQREIMPGKFAVVFPGQTYFEIIVNEPSFRMESDTSDLIGHMKIDGSVENQVFYDYIGFINGQKRKIEPLQKAYGAAEKEKKKEELREKMLAIDQAVKARQRELAGRRNELLIAQIIALSIDIEVPDPPTAEDGSIDSSFQYRYYRDHYFDLVNLKNEAVVRCPAYHQKLDQFFDKVLLQHPDTINKYADRLISQMDETGDLFKYTVNYVFNKYNRSKIMGMKTVMVHMAEQYYMNDKAYWADSTTVAKISERAVAEKPTLMGKKAPRLNLADTTGKKIVPLYGVNAEYTILCFWSATCGHCKKAIPKLKIIYDMLKDHGVEVYAVGTELENEDWLKFIRKEKLNWINVSDTPERPDRFRTTYDIYSTPKLYILDKDKKDHCPSCWRGTGRGNCETAPGPRRS